MRQFLELTTVKLHHNKKFTSFFPDSTTCTASVKVISQGGVKFHQKETSCAKIGNPCVETKNKIPSESICTESEYIKKTRLFCQTHPVQFN